MRPLLRRRTPPEVTWSPIPGRGLRGLSGRAGAMGDDAQAADGVAWRVDFGSPAAPNARISLWTYTVERYRGQTPFYEVGIRYQDVVPGSPCTFSYTDADAADEGNWDSIADGCLAALDLAERFAKHVPGLTSLFPQIFDWDGTP